MLESIRKMWKVADLRKKILYTFGMLLLFRLVGCVPAPGINHDALNTMASYDLLALMNMMTGGALSQWSLMAMGITPYINSSIIMQLLTIAIPALERMQADEEGGGRQKIAKITRYVTIALAAVQAIGLSSALGAAAPGFYNKLLVGVSMAGGTALALWIGERITEKGVGNGVSLLIFAGIVSNLFNGVTAGVANAIATPSFAAWMAPVVIILVLMILVFVVTLVDMGERRIPLQIAKQVKGRRVYGGQNTHMSLKVISVGVLPLIFAYSFLAFPGTIIQIVAPRSAAAAWWATYMGQGSILYMLISGLLIVAFTFFYSSISFDPKKQAEQLIMQGATIPGQRGKNIAAYLAKTNNRLNLFAALFLAVLAAVPTILMSSLKISMPFAASSMLIAVSVSLETIRTIRGEMSIRGMEMDINGFM